MPSTWRSMATLLIGDHHSIARLPLLPDELVPPTEGDGPLIERLIDSRDRQAGVVLDDLLRERGWRR